MEEQIAVIDGIDADHALALSIKYDRSLAPNGLRKKLLQPIDFDRAGNAHKHLASLPALIVTRIQCKKEFGFLYRRFSEQADSATADHDCAAGISAAPAGDAIGIGK